MPITIRWPLKALLLSLFCLAFLISQVSAAERAEAYYHFLAGIKAYQEGKLYEARKELLKTIKKDPKAIYPRKILIEIYGRLGEYDKAEAVARKALKLSPGDDDILYLLAKVYLSQNRPARAIVTLEKILERSPQDERALGLLTKAYLSEKDLSGAISSVERLLAIHPEAYHLWLLKARLLARTERISEAKEAYLKAVSISGEKLQVVLEAGEFLKKIGALAEAEDLYRRYLEKNPEDFHVKQALLEILLAEGKWSEARSLLEETLQQDPENPRALFFLGLVFEKEGQQEKALELYRQIPRDSLFFTEAVRRTYSLILDLKGPEEGLAYLKEITREVEDNPEIFVFAANAAEDLDRCEEGLAFAEKGLARFSGNRDLILAKGLLLSCLGKLREALRLVEPLLEEDPDDPVVLNFVGYTYAELGENLSEAEQYIRKALKTMPEAGYIVDSLAWVLFKQGKLKEAFQEIKRAVELSPGDAVIREHEGDILKALGRLEEACRSYEEALKRAKHRRDRERIEKKVSACQGENF